MDPHIVYLACASRGYDGIVLDAFPELLPGAVRSQALLAVRNLFLSAQLDAAHMGTPEWNPLGDSVSGKRCVIKPNWVHHKNGSHNGLDCLISHTSVIEAIIEYVALARPSSIIVGDAPIQSCDFGALRELAGINSMLARLLSRGIQVDCRDFRLTQTDRSVWDASLSTGRSEKEYVRFNLGQNSMLEMITDERSQFRVTMYDPRALEETHSPGNHQYLIAREIMDADVVINLPKLKTHKKAGLTGTLKNLVGANGHKSYLPHHRKGGTASGGDCYPKTSVLKSVAEDLFDWTNSVSPGYGKRILAKLCGSVVKVGKFATGSMDLEGSWHGNDTVWRMVLDLQHILHHGTSSGTLEAGRQRFILNITDAIIGGQGDGPLSPEPIEFGFLTLGTNAAICDWMHAILMGLNPNQIPVIREAIQFGTCGNASRDETDFKLRFGENLMSPLEAAKQFGKTVSLPSGWIGACEAPKVC